jgi:hypothetical protein
VGANRMMNTPCTILRREATGEDKYGDPIFKDVAVQTVCALQQRRREEHDEGGEVSDTLSDLFLPTGTEVGAGDAILVRGWEYEVVGEPWSAEEGSPSLWHVEATVQRTTGTGDDEDDS